jgi:hypothetical protein
MTGAAPKTFDVHLRYLHCGGNQFIQPSKLEPDAVVTCSGCRRTSTLQALRKQAFKASEKLVADRLRNLLKR